MSPDLVALPEPIEYAPHLCCDRLQRPAGRAVIRQAIDEGRSIRVYRDVDYVRLFHALDQLVEAYQYTIARQTQRDGTSIVFLVPRDSGTLLMN